MAGKYLFMLAALTAGASVAVPASYADLGDSQRVVDDFWDTRGRVDVPVDAALSPSPVEISSSFLVVWAFSPLVDIWSTPTSGFRFILR